MHSKRKHTEVMPESSNSSTEIPTAGRYEVRLEIAGPVAMFARPDTGGTPVSYPIPTQSAAKGIFESIARLASGDAWFEPVSVAICKPIGKPGGNVQFQSYATNYGGPLRKSNQLASGSSYQFFATVLSNVCYRLTEIIQSGERPWKHGENPRHHLKDLFDRRLYRGQCHRTPCLGWSEFTATYWGGFRDNSAAPSATEIDTGIDLLMPSLLLRVFDRPTNGIVKPAFVQNARVTSGVHYYVE